ncbi:hypothetical protein IV102_21825 [bacterium]|nr:hypothetical protein [bacterium]
MKTAYHLFQESQPQPAQDSPLIVCFRQLWQRLAVGQQPTSGDLSQVNHMALWLQGQVEQYDHPLPGSDHLQPVFAATQQGWALMLDGVYCLADYLEQGDEQLLAEAHALSEEGEEMLKQLEEAIVAERDGSSLCCDGYLE